MNRRRFIRRASGLIVPMLAAGIAPAVAQSARIRRSNYIPSFTPLSFTTVDVLVRFDAGTDGAAPSVTNLNDSTYGLSNGTWTKVGTAVTVLDASNDAVLPGLALSGGSGYGDSTTKCLRRPLDTNPGDEYPLFTFTSSKATLCYGFAFKMSAFTGQFDFWNIMRSNTGGGAFLTPSIETNNNDLFMFPHAAADGASIGPLAHDTWHWAAIKRDQSGTAYLRVYELPSLTLIGSSTTTLATGNVTDVRCGHGDSTGQTAAGENLYWDDIAMAFSDVHPLVPTV